MRISGLMNRITGLQPEKGELRLQAVNGEKFPVRLAFQYD
ncbi:MAG: hypothetical protein FD123_4291 [Bacteroidetes bacterium]|nr:MAG: hypothetical protein FD123_4291 [Bacteroidota bacterium]